MDGKHNDGNTDHLNQIGEKIRYAVTEKPIQGFRIGIDLSNQSSRMARREKGIRQSLKGRKYSLFQITGNEGGNLGADNSVYGGDKSSQKRRKGNGQHESQDLPVARAAGGKNLVIQDLAFQIGRNHADSRGKQNGQKDQSKMLAVTHEKRQ